MNYEVICMVDFMGVVDRAYFETYVEAAEWEKRNKGEYDGTSILPLNPEAEAAMS